MELPETAILGDMGRIRVAMDCDIEGWNQLGERSSTLDYFDYPKMFERC